MRHGIVCFPPFSAGRTAWWNDVLMIPSLSSKGVPIGYQNPSLERYPTLNQRSDPHSEWDVVYANALSVAGIRAANMATWALFGREESSLTSGIKVVPPRERQSIGLLSTLEPPLGLGAIDWRGTASVTKSVTKVEGRKARDEEV